MLTLGLLWLLTLGSGVYGNGLLRTDAPIASLDILHFNDAYDIEKSARFAHEFMARNSDATLRVFSGDIYSPSTVSLFQRGKQFAEPLKYFNLHASVLGNHEFDFGEPWFLELRELNPEMDWLNANLRHKISLTLVGNAVPSKIVEIGEVKVGLFGLIDQDWLDASALKAEDVELEDPVEVARRVSNELKADGCTFVIALTHMCNANDRRVLEDSGNAVDIILGGHDHIYYVQLLNHRVLLKSGCDFGHFSKLRLELSRSPLKSVTAKDEFEFLVDEKVNEDEYNTFSFSVRKYPRGPFLNIVIDKVAVSPLGPKDPVIDKYLTDFVKPLTNSFSRPVFYLLSDLETRGQVIRHQESAICDFVTDLVKIGSDADLAVLTAGGFRLEKVLKAGNIFRYIDAIHLLPFYEEIEIFWLTGQEVLEMLNDGVESMLANTAFMSVSGVTATFDPEMKPMHRVLPEKVLVDGQLLDLKRVYRVATTSYLGQGKSGFKVFSEHKGRQEIVDALSPLKCLKEAWEMASNADFQSEFELFKQHYPTHTISSLITVMLDPDYHKMYYTMHPNLLESHGPEGALRRMSLSALRRFMYYSLFSSIKEVEGVRIFGIDLQEPVHRVTPVILEDL